MKIKLYLIFILLAMSSVFAQDELEIYLIDSYVTPEVPHTFVLSYFTSDSAKSRVVIEDNLEYPMSEELTDYHEIKIDVSKIDFDSSKFTFNIFAEDKNGNEIKSQDYTVELPYEDKIYGEKDPSLFTLCLGGIIIFLPSPTYVQADGNDYFALSKEIPIFSFYSIGQNYPVSYFSLEYTHIFNKENNDLLRAGYKYLIQPPVFKFIAPGVSAFTNFGGYHGAGAELSVGLFDISVFTVYTKYRYNFEFAETENDFHEISIGLFSSFFTINL